MVILKTTTEKDLFGAHQWVLLVSFLIVHYKDKNPVRHGP